MPRSVDSSCSAHTRPGFLICPSVRLSFHYKLYCIPAASVADSSNIWVTRAFCSWIAFYLDSESFPMLSCFYVCAVVFCLMPHSVGGMVDAKVNSIYTWAACLVWELGWVCQ